MRPIIDFAELDLRGALDFAILIEEDAQLRYEQLARLLGDDAGGAGEVFRSMVETEGHHRTVLLERRAALLAGAPPRVEISVMGSDVERFALDDELPRTAREALELCRSAERHAFEFYRDALPALADPEARAFFRGLMAEEVEHEAVLAARIAALDAGAPAAPPPAPAAAAPPPAPAEPLPPREVIEASLGAFDAATRAVARSVLLEGVPEREVAAAIGVSRRSIGRKVAGFLAVVRRHAAVAVAAATLAGCAGNLRSGELEDREALRPPPAPSAEASTPQPSHVRGEEVPREERGGLARGIRAEIARRMPRYDSTTHDRLARTILAEARLARLDPLLVLAVIHVESAFDPDALSPVGAVGLMQLLEPTMEEELRRSGIAFRDPSDPIANVQAGVRYLRRLLRSFDGEVNVALMAYNAGPGRILGHLRGGSIPERFHEYPERVNRELSRLRAALEAGERPVLTRGAQGAPEDDAA